MGLSLRSASLSREKIVFGATVVVILLLGVSLAGSILEDPKDNPRPKSPTFEEPRSRAAWLVPPADEVYRSGARDPFREPREIEDLAPLDLPLPPPPSLALVVPPPWTDLEPKALAMLRRPFDVKEAAPAAAEEGGESASAAPPSDGDGAAKAGDAPPAPPSGGGSASPAETPVAGAKKPAPSPSKKKPLEETYDSVTLKGGKTVHGRIQVPDAIELLGEELDAKEDRFEPKPGVKFKMVVHDPTSGKSLGSTEYDATQIDSIQPMRTVETRARLETRRFAASDVRGRVALGRYCLERGVLPPARSAFEAALSIDPSNADAILGLGATHRAAFDWDAEAVLYEKAIESGAGGAAVRVRMAEIETLFGLDAEAEATLREGQKVSPGDASLSLELGKLLRGSSATHDEALALLTRAADGAGSTADRARAFEAVAEAALREGDVKKAKEFAGKARDASPERGTGSALAAAAAILEADGAGAKKLFEAAVSRADVDPGVAAYGSALADALTGASPSAVDAALARAEADWPLRAAYPLSARAYVALREGKLDAAQDFLEAAIEADPSFAYPRYVLGRLYAHAGDSAKAEESLRKALDLEPEFADALGELSLAALAGDDAEAGVRFASRAITIEPERTDLRTLRALHRLRARSAEAARSELLDVARDASGDGEIAAALNALAVLTYREGGAAERLQAIDYFQRVIEAGADGSGKVRAADLAYAKNHVAAIRDNASKVQWLDGFNRTDLKRGWEESDRYGVDVKLEDGALRFAGRQTQEDKATTVLNDFKHGSLVSFEVALDVPKSTNARVGVLIGNFPKDDLYAGLEVARDPKGGLAIRTTRAGKPGAWEPVEGVTWPDGTKTVVALELVDLKLGVYSLRLGGRVVAPEIKVDSLRGFNQTVKLGVFGTARLGAEYSFTADDVRVVLKKE